MTQPENWPKRPTYQDQKDPLQKLATTTQAETTRCNRPEFPPSQFFPRGKTGPAHSFPGEETD